MTHVVEVSFTHDEIVQSKGDPTTGIQDWLRESVSHAWMVGNPNWSWVIHPDGQVSYGYHSQTFSDVHL